MSYIDFALGFFNGVLLSSLFWGIRHANFEKRLKKVLDSFEDETEEE